MHNGPAEGTWAALVHAVHEETDVLVAEFVHQVLTLPTYDRGVVPHDRLEADAMASFDYLLRRLGGLPLHERLADSGPEIGRDRARRGVPLDHLLTAVRLDFRVLWNALRRRSGPEHRQLLVERAEDVWSVVEEYTTTVQVSYLEEAAVLAREQGRERAALVRRLLARTDPDPQDVSGVALALDVDPAAPFLVVAASVHQDKELRAAAEQLLVAGRPVHLDETSQHTTLIARWHSDRLDAATTSSLLGAARCGVAPVAAGLAEVPRAVRVAREIVDVLPPDANRPHDLERSWALLAGARLGDLAPRLATAALGGLERLPEGERSRLLDTALSFAASGSVQETARELYCHRNTVLNRLHRFREVTGLDMARPRDAALVLVTSRWAVP